MCGNDLFFKRHKHTFDSCIWLLGKYITVAHCAFVPLLDNEINYESYEEKNKHLRRKHKLNSPSEVHNIYIEENTEWQHTSFTKRNILITFKVNYMYIGL